MENNHPHPVVSFRNAAFRIRDRVILPGTSWEIFPNQNWAVLGPNGAGKSTLVRALAGDVPVVRGSAERNLSPDRVGFVSFEFHRDLAAAEENLQFARHFSGNPDEKSSARRILFSKNPELDLGRQSDEENSEIPEEFREVVSLLGLDDFVDRGIGMLSTGQMRKLLIARALVKRPKLLILDEPFDGLDIESRRMLLNALENIMDGRFPVVFVGHRPDELPTRLTHAILLKDGVVSVQGEKDAVLTNDNLIRLYEKPAGRPSAVIGGKRRAECGDEVVFSLKGGKVRYGEVVVFENLDWTVRKGENWAITGPNGAGKSTLLNMVSADNPQAYANELVVFGKPRGSGESIWEIKQRIGVVSNEFQIRYRKTITAFETILSGFFDSVGLYRLANAEQRKKAVRWAENFGLNGLEDRPFDRLSHGEQRMVLLARSMVKSPEILVLDEPCQGLDTRNRQAVLDLIDRIGSQTDTQLLYVTHHPEEIPACTTHVLLFERLDSGAFTARSIERED